MRRSRRSRENSAMLSSCPCCPTLRTMQNRFPVPSGSRTSCSLPCSSASRSKRWLNGFRNVILMGDHAGGQPQVYEEVANKLNARYGTLRVFYCDQVYKPASDAFDQYLVQ